MDKELEKKYDRLKAVIADLGPCLVAFSGGVDSSLLLKAAQDALGDKIVAATLRSILNQPGELDQAVETARRLGAKHVILDYAPLEIQAIRNNSRDRCYHCKKALAQVLLDQAKSLGLEHVVEGSQADDAAHYRPGAKALLEAGIKSPMREAGLSKDQVRRLARHLGLLNWNRPAGGCLATRFPYDMQLDENKLNQVFQAERVLSEMDIIGARARHHGDLVRLEISPENLDRLGDPSFRKELAARLKSCGFSFVTVDLEGYRSGVYDH